MLKVSLRLSVIVAFFLPFGTYAADDSRVRGLLLGSLIGDAAGGPVEFAETAWEADDLLNKPLSSNTLESLGKRFRLRDYPMKAAPYAQWIDYAPAGTITDDSRHKLILLESIETHGEISRRAYLKTLIDYYQAEDSPDSEWRRQWFDEYMTRFRWIAREEFPEIVIEGRAYPPQRVWGGIPTMAGQMPLLVIAGAYPGNPEQAYLTAWELNILDTGYAMDCTSALVAGLAQALVDESDSWETVIRAMRNTDPYDFAEVPWVERRFDRWLNRALEIGRAKHATTVAFFENLERIMEAETWWEAHVPMVITFSIFEYTGYNPLASMELALAFGHDTDSTAQLMGAFLGAKLGLDIFPKALTKTVETQLQLQYQENVDRFVELLIRHRKAP